MSIDRFDFDNLSENDLAELIVGQVPEGLRIDYKRDLYGNSDADKRELLKDISGFANAFGGHLIVGMEEQNGLATGIPGVANVNPDDVVLRLEQLARTGLEPRIQGLRIRAVPLSSGAYCFVLRIPRSWHPPHRVSAQNSNRFWIRNSGGTHEASVDELRTLFTIGADASHRVQQFRDERLREITSGQGLRPLMGDGRMILHIVPLAAVTSSWQVDLAKVFELQKKFRPIGGAGMSPRYNLDGFVNERGGEHNFGYTQIFRSGALEATKASIVTTHQGKRYIPSGLLEKQIFESLPDYINELRDLGIPPPLIVLITLEGVKDAAYKVRNSIFDDPEPVIERDVVFLPECVINEYGEVAEYHRAVKPAFDALWNTAGCVSAQTFSADGVWVGNVQNL
ncbi:MAG: ATP-binding protein [Oxalobacteraceae bacterium]|nr:ATP-binding protein [Oxalobacteraceae bacterium]